MRQALLIVISISAILFTGCTTSESNYRVGYDFSQLDSIAVVDVVGQVGGDAVKNQIGDFFVNELLKKGYSPIERAQVQSILNEQKFQSSKITSSQSIAKAGEILNVKSILIVNVPKFKDEINITAKMLDVQDGSILWIGTAQGETGEFWNTVVGVTAGAVVGAVVSDSDNTGTGAVIGGIAGGAAGNMLSPQVAQKTQEIIRELCKDMPYRMK